MEERIDYVGDAVVAEFLRLIRGVIVLHSERTGDSDVLESASNKSGDAAWKCLRDECPRRNLGRGNTRGMQLDDFEEIAVGVLSELLVDSVANSSEQDQTEKSPRYR